jgi:hypothetical protein
MLQGIAAGLPEGNKRLPMIMVAAEEHRRAGLAAVTGKHYEGGHWLGALQFISLQDGAFRKSEL